jgi:hypothetical protein
MVQNRVRGRGVLLRSSQRSRSRLEGGRDSRSRPAQSPPPQTHPEIMRAAQREAQRRWRAKLKASSLTFHQLLARSPGDATTLRRILRGGSGAREDRVRRGPLRPQRRTARRREGGARPAPALGPPRAGGGTASSTGRPPFLVGSSPLRRSGRGARLASAVRPLLVGPDHLGLDRRPPSDGALERDALDDPAEATLGFAISASICSRSSSVSGWSRVGIRQCPSNRSALDGPTGHVRATPQL